MYSSFSGTLLLSWPCLLFLSKGSLNLQTITTRKHKLREIDIIVFRKERFRANLMI